MITFFECESNFYSHSSTLNFMIEDKSIFLNDSSMLFLSFILELIIIEYSILAVINPSKPDSPTSKSGSYFLEHFT